MSDRLERELLALLGPQAFLTFLEHFAGRRFYVPREPRPDIVAAIGQDAAAKIAARFGGDYPMIPLARAFRASQYRAAGLDDGLIAMRLGMTVRGVEKLFKARFPDSRRPRKRDPRQIDMFGVASGDA